MTRTYYDYFYNVLDWELQQAKEYGDTTTTDKNKILPFEQGKRVVNEAVKNLVKRNPNAFEQEWTYTFSGDTYEFTVPFYIYRIISYFDDSEGVWTILPDSSDLQASIKSKGHNTIYNSDGWSKGDSLLFKVVKYPEEVRYNVTAGDGIGDYDVVDFPDEYIRLLTLMVKKHAYNRKGKAMSNFEYIELQEELTLWKQNGGRVKQKSMYAATGHGFGRGRG